MFKRSVFFLLFLVSLPVWGEIRLCYEERDVFPWVLRDRPGLNIILLQKVDSAAGFVFRMDPVSWKRCLVYVERGVYDGAIGASYTESRAAFAAYPRTADGQVAARYRLMNDAISVYRRKGDAAGWDGRHFSALNQPVGVQKGYSVIADLEKMAVPYDDGTTECWPLLMKLSLRRVSLALVQSREGEKVLRENPELAEKLEALPLPFAAKPYFLIFNKTYAARNPELVWQVWQAIETQRESRDYQSLERGFR